MKTTKILVLLIFFCSSCGTNLDKGVIKNKPKFKSETTQIYEAIKEGDSIKPGYKIKSSGLDQNEKKLYFYDKKNRLIKLIKDSIEIYTYQYNDFDSIKKVNFKSGDFESQSYLNYNDKNFLIQRVDSVKGKKMLVIKKKYDNDHQVLRVTTIYPETPSTEIIEKTYNSDKKLSEVKTERVGYSITKNIYQYPNDKTVIIKSDYINDSNYTEIKRIYDKNNILIKERITPIGSERFMIVEQKRDKLGNLKSHVQINEVGDTIRLWKYQYLYDSNNNWIQKINYLDDKPLSFIKREIKYKH